MTDLPEWIDDEWIEAVVSVAASEAPEVLERYISRKSAPQAHPEATAGMLADMPTRGNA